MIPTKKTSYPPVKVGGVVGALIHPTVPDLLTLTSYGLGLWWCFGGPTWAGLTSIALDEVDGRLARATGTTSERGASLDWGNDLILTPLSLRRLGGVVAHPNLAMAAAPAILYVQATMKSQGIRPTLGSARAAIMLLAMATERLKGKMSSGI